MANALVVEYDPLAASVQSDPYPYYAALREHSPVRYVDALNAYVVSRHADVRRVMRDHQSFSSEAMAALVSRPVQYAADADLARMPATTHCRSSASTETIIPAFARS